MQRRDRTLPEGITEAPRSPVRQRDPCTCTPSYQAQAWDNAAGKRITPNVPDAPGRRDPVAPGAPLSTLRRRQPSPPTAAPRSGKRPMKWLTAARAGVVRTPLRASPTSRPRSAATSRTSGCACCPTLGHDRLGEIDAAAAAAVRRPARRRRARGHRRSAADDRAAPGHLPPRRPARRRASATPRAGWRCPRRPAPERGSPSPDEIDAHARRARAPRDRALWATALYAGLRARRAERAPPARTSTSPPG